MDSLLRWGIENSTAPTSNQIPPEPRRDLDPAIIDAILGKPDAELMKEALVVAIDDQKDEAERLTALDDFEMLIEQIDNANNITTMKMWSPLHDLLTASNSSEDIKANVLWIIGTAVQNNPSAQDAYFTHSESSLPTIISLLSLSDSAPTRSKAVYTLSGLLKHNSKAVKSLEKFKGWDALNQALQDPDITVRRKTAFLLNALLLPSALPSISMESATPIHTDATLPSVNNEGPVHPNSHASMTAETTETSAVTSKAIKDHGLMSTVIDALVNPVPFGRDGENESDIDFTEKTVRLLFTYVTGCNGQLGESEKVEIRGWLQQQKDRGEIWNLSEVEHNTLMQAL